MKREGDAVTKEVAEVRAVVDGLESAAAATGQSLAEVEQRLDQVRGGRGRGLESTKYLGFQRAGV